MPHIHVDTAHPVDLYYEDHGTGDPVVLIHGWPLSGRSWESQVQALVSAGHRVITYDRRGFGASSQPFDGYDYDTFAEDLDAVLTQLDLEGVTLVGFSMGGGEVVRYIARHGSQRIAAAVLAAAVPPYLYKSSDNPDGGIDDAMIDQFLTGVDDDRPAFLEGFFKTFFSAGGDLKASPQVLDYSAQIARFASAKGTRDCITAFAKTDFRGDLAKVDVPTLVIHGDSDGIVPFEVSGQRAAAAIADSKLVVIKGAPHGFNVTHAAEFNEALLSFMKSAARTPAMSASTR